MKNVEELAKNNNYEIIDISNKDSEFYDIGPAEFLYLEKNASLVVTDSFHSCVFSIIFNTPFAVVERDDNGLPSMHSRIETLLGKFNMEFAIVKNEISNEILNNNFENTLEIIKKEKEKTYKFLEKMFK